MTNQTTVMMNTPNTNFPIGEINPAHVLPTVARVWTRRTHAPHGSSMQTAPDPNKDPAPKPVREPGPTSPPVKEPTKTPDEIPPSTPSERPADPRPTPNNPPDITAETDKSARRSIPGAEPRIVNAGPESDTDPSKGDHLDPSRKDR